MNCFGSTGRSGVDASLQPVISTQPPGSFQAGVSTQITRLVAVVYFNANTTLTSKRSFIFLKSIVLLNLSSDPTLEDRLYML